MSFIEEYISNMTVSRSVFRAERPAHSGRISSIRFTLTNQIKPIPSSDDPIERMICSHYEQDYDPHSKKVKNRTNCHEIRRLIADNIRNIYALSAGIKNVRMSSNCDFIYNIFKRVPEDIVLSLYRYLDKNLISGTFHLNDNVHKNNLINIISGMRKKYGV
jgi:hypothetical protein